MHLTPQIWCGGKSQTCRHKSQTPPPFLLLLLLLVAPLPSLLLLLLAAVAWLSAPALPCCC
jgi:hypothetical protein